MPTQQTLEGMPRRWLFVGTPTKLGTWLDCPRRFGFSYLTKERRGGPWAHSSLGASVHNALREWWLLPPRERTPTRVGRSLHENWIDLGYRDDAQSNLHRDRARGWVERYVARARDEGLAEPLGVERQVATRTATLAVNGRVDRLDLRGGELVVVDYKTGRRPPGVDDARGSMALALYAVAGARTLRRPAGKVELHHLPTGEVTAHEHAEAGLARHLARAEEIAAEAAEIETAARAGDPQQVHARLVPRTGPLCSWCDFRALCPEGRAASPPRRPWDGVDDD